MSSTSETSLAEGCAQSPEARASGVIERLKSAIQSGNWGEVASLLDRRFFRYLFDAPDVLSQAFSTAPDAFYEVYPRHAMSRAIYAAGDRSIMMVDQFSRARFSEWVAVQQKALLRDKLVELLVAIWEALMVGWYDAAARAAASVFALLRTQPDDLTGVDDIAPLALVECGVVKLLVEEWDSALVCFREALQWCAVGEPHPFSTYAREYLALGYVLCAQHRSAEVILRREPARAAAEGFFHRHYGTARVLAEMFDAIALLNFDRAEELILRYEQESSEGYLGWFAIHARALITLWRGDPWVAIHALEEYLRSEAARTQPDVAVGTVLRSDLASLYQAVGDLRGATLVLGTPGLLLDHQEMLAPRVRQELMCGRLGDALRILEGGTLGSVTPTRASSCGASLHAIIEHAATGAVTEETLHVTALAMNRQRTYFVLFQVPDVLREALRPLLEIEFPDARAAFRYEVPVRLTVRERELLAALSYDRTVDEIANEMHISVNTARTHVRTLYQKLGAHSRDEALWLGRGIVSSARLSSPNW